MTMCNYKRQLLIFVLIVSVVTIHGRRSGGGSRSRGSTSRGTSHGTTHYGTSHSSPSHYGTSYSSPSHSSPSHYGTSHSSPSHYGTSHSTGGGGGASYGWKTNGGHGGHGHYYNSPSPASSPTNWGSSYGSSSYRPQQSAFGKFQPVSSGVSAPSYHFHKSTSYVPIYIPSSHSYIHHTHHTHSGQSSTSSTTANNNPPPPPSEPVVYKEESSSGDSAQPTMIVGFNNMIVYGVFESDKHYVITISEDLDEDMDDIPEHFLRTEDSSLFDIVTMKPTTTTTEYAPTANDTTTTRGDFDDWTDDWKCAPVDSAPIDKSDGGNGTHTSEAAKGEDDNDSDALSLYFGDVIL